MKGGGRGANRSTFSHAKRLLEVWNSVYVLDISARIAWVSVHHLLDDEEQRALTSSGVVWNKVCFWFRFHSGVIASCHDSRRKKFDCFRCSQLLQDTLSKLKHTRFKSKGAGNTMYQRHVSLYAETNYYTVCMLCKKIRLNCNFCDPGPLNIF